MKQQSRLKEYIESIEADVIVDWGNSYIRKLLSARWLGVTLALSSQSSRRTHPLLRTTGPGRGAADIAGRHRRFHERFCQGNDKCRTAMANGGGAPLKIETSVVVTVFSETFRSSRRLTV